MFDPSHLVFDLTAYLLATTLILLFKHRQLAPSLVPSTQMPMYLLVMALGAITGSLLLGTANVLLMGNDGLVIAKSIVGALAGGIVATELFKRRQCIQGSTGAVLVPGLALGIFVGRWGCFNSGLNDLTFGVPTTMPLGYDFGDGITRHPVQLYEAFSMLVFGTVASWRLCLNDLYWWRQGFYYFTIAYAAQRFVWEFLKPYPELVIGLNVFQLLCIALVIYGAVMLASVRDQTQFKTEQSP